MRILKSLLCALSLSALFLVSCGNENEPTNPGGGGTVPPVHTDPSMLVTSMIGYENDSCNFTYDSNNRLTYVKGMNEDMNYYYEFSYSPLRIVAGDYKDIFIEYDLKVNDNGYITYLKDNEGNVRMYEYQDGYLVKSISSDGPIIYTWQNGNLEKIESRGKDGNLYSIYKYSYTEKSTNNTGIYFPHIEEDPYLLLGGFLGKTTSKIPESVEVTLFVVSEQTEKMNISVEYDSEGRIIKEFYNDELIYVYAYEGNKAVWPEN